MDCNAYFTFQRLIYEDKYMKILDQQRRNERQNKRFLSVFQQKSSTNSAAFKTAIKGKDRNEFKLSQFKDFGRTYKSFGIIVKNLTVRRKGKQKI